MNTTGDTTVSSPEDITAITIPLEERAVILRLWGSPQAFAEWQADALRSEVERRAAAEAAPLAAQVVEAEVQGVRDQIPSLFEQ
jgi:hypothetical protein